MEQGGPRENSASSIEWTPSRFIFMLEYPPKIQIPSKIRILKGICILGGHPSMELERDGVHSIELIKFYLFVWVSAFGPLNGRIVVDFTIKSRILEGFCILGEHPSMEMERDGVHSIELVEFYLSV